MYPGNPFVRPDFRATVNTASLRSQGRGACWAPCPADSNQCPLRMKSLSTGVSLKELSSGQWSQHLVMKTRSPHPGPTKCKRPNNLPLFIELCSVTFVVLLLFYAFPLTTYVLTVLTVLKVELPLSQTHQDVCFFLNLFGVEQGSMVG